MRDGSCGAVVSCLGHSDREVIEAIKAQLDRLPYAHTSFFTNEPMEALAEDLVRHAPEGIARATQRELEELKAKHIRRIYGQVYLVLEDGALCAHRQTAAMCQNLLDGYDNLFEFSRHRPGLVEPTNNAAERALRHPVIWKQLTFSTQSTTGSQWVSSHWRSAASASLRLENGPSMGPFTGDRSAVH